MSLITLNEGDFRHNLELFKTHVKNISNSKAEVGIVLKDNAYGHGLQEMSLLAQKAGIKNVFVKNFTEAKLIASSFENVTFFYGLPKEKIKNIYTTLHSLDNLAKIESSIGDISDLNVELKVNIGMNRNGIEPKDLAKCIDSILSKKVNLIGVFGHNGYGDCSDEDEFNLEVKKFNEVKEEVAYLSKKQGFKLPRFHSFNTACTLRAKRYDDDLVRIGMGLYGYADLMHTLASKLRPILKLYAHKISTKLLSKGDKVGYNGITKIKKICDVSTYDIGYGDGLYRTNGNRILLLPNGNEVLPISSMDCFSTYGSEECICVMDNAVSVAEAFDTIPYEVLTRLSSFIPRQII
ncbi:alanine racemase [Helicobacter sp. 11S02629-2]|uniref:alanine racemase n=1 Tax=Helicobacter sp. 11S02629-2 TaxID=1476195 RepID=UPI000BA4F576|nr:alanine racemase [Helicobacter sp. 11S02629-2]PAF45777.1 alanine racemase [Helicobacter sp. 11S02629-2]